MKNVHRLALFAAISTGCATAPRAPRNTIASIDTLSAPDSSERARRQEPAVPEAATPEAPAHPEIGASERDEWRFVISPYGWLLSVDGSATINGQESTIDQEFDDILDNLSFVAEARFEAWKGKWGGFADLTYAKLESDIEAGPIEGDSETDIVLGFVGGLLRFVDRPYQDHPGGLTVDALVGAAYTSIDSELDIDDGPSFDGDKDWIDLVVGLRTRFQVTEKWGGSLETILGGFGLTDGSDLVTMNTAMIGRRFGNSSHLYFGWRTLDIDYDEGDDFAVNININGPIIGYEWSF